MNKFTIAHNFFLHKSEFMKVAYYVIHKLPVQACLILCQGYILKNAVQIKTMKIDTYNSHLKQCISWGLGD